MLPKISGYCLAGWAKKPPKLGPTTEPSDQTKGMIEKALGWSSLSGTISATMVRMMPTSRVAGQYSVVKADPMPMEIHSPLPLPPPWIARTVMAIGRLVDMPHTTKVIIVLSKPAIRTGFRPKRSDAFPQGTAVMLWDREKTAEVSPAHCATLFCSTPKPRIISGRYGKTEV